ncbi:MAG: metallophosphoesterase [Gaiellales bacterium]
MAGRPLFVVGDVHGHRDVLAALLRDAGLIDAADHWCGGDARLWLIGDLVDRGPDGLGAIELAIELERSGGVGCLLGNHEVLLLCALLHGDVKLGPGRETYFDLWELNGGRLDDLRGLRSEHLEWLNARPAVAAVDGWALLHADTDRYLELGRDLASINYAVSDVLLTAEPDDLGLLLERLTGRFGLVDPERLERVLTALGASRVVHGHTPIAVVLDRHPLAVTEALVSPDRRVVNVDHCLFGGGRGFVTRLDELG